MVARLLVLAAVVLSAFMAPLAVAKTMPALDSVVEAQAQPMTGMEGMDMADCHRPIEEKQVCKVDCNLCHAYSPLYLRLGSRLVSYMALAPAEPPVWTECLAEVEPPVPRSAS